MPDKLLNEAEEYLLERWKDAFAMEQQMEKVRKKYKSVCQRIVDIMREKHQELDVGMAWPIQFSGSGTIGVGRKCWPAKAEDFSGFWLCNLRLELLVKEDSRPCAFVWVLKQSGADDLSQVKQAILASVPRILSESEQAEWKREEPDESESLVLRYDLPESNEAILTMLKQGDGQGFVDCMIGHLESLARFTPVLNEVLAKETK